MYLLPTISGSMPEYVLCVRIYFYKFTLKLVIEYYLPFSVCNTEIHNTYLNILGGGILYLGFVPIKIGYTKIQGKEAKNKRLGLVVYYSPALGMDEPLHPSEPEFHYPKNWVHSTLRTNLGLLQITN